MPPSRVPVRRAVAATFAALALVLRDGARIVVIGLVAGLALAVAGARLLAGMLFGVGTGDVPTYLAVTALLATVALVAALVPARRAANADPSTALRAD